MRSLSVLLLVVSFASAQSWTTWRGSDGLAGSPESNPPTEWGEDKNVRWKTELPGVGSSSPISWKDRIYVTCAVETDRKGEPTGKPMKPPSGRRGRRWTPPPLPTTFYEFLVVAVDRGTGKIAWSTKVADVVPHEGRGHETSSYAAPSPITDGKHVFAFFGSRGLHCLDLDGNIIWSKDLGRMRTMLQFGEGSTPLLHQDKLVVNWDHEDQSFIAAFQKQDGNELWRTPRDEKSTWASPVAVSVNGTPQVIIPGVNKSMAYDLETGKPIWSCGGMTRACIPTPIVSDGTCYIMSGFMGAALQAIDLKKAKGDITDGRAFRWRHDRGTSYVPSALLYRGLMYFVRNNNGVLTCLDAKTAKVHYEGQRMPGLKTVYASPVGAGDHVYFTSREGKFKVIKHGTEFEEVANNELNDVFDASPAVVGDALYLRGHKNLYCIAKSARPTGAGSRFGGRRVGPRQLRPNGGGGKTQRAVERGLAWLQRRQQADGSWAAETPNRAVLLTGLASLGYLGCGSTHESRTYQDVLWGSLGALEQRQRQGGRFAGSDTLAHAVATLTLAEAFAMSKDDMWRKPAQRGLDALRSIVKDDRGGWTDPAAAPSSVGWLALALKAGEAAGLKVDPAVKAHVLGLAQSSESGLFARILLGERDRDALEKIGDKLLKRLPAWGAGQVDFHRWHFDAYGLFQLGGRHWKAWNPDFVKTLVKNQHLDKGTDDGSWDPVGPGTGLGSRSFQTALGVLCMQVYYRYGRMLRPR